jgi:hypothetical protein
MTPAEIVRHRLGSQQLSGTAFTKPEEIVAHLGAMQAQEFSNAKWAVGARLPGATEADVDDAVARRAIVRTWPMRGTLHFVAAADVRWMLALLTPRIIAGTASRQQRLELDDAVFAATRKRLTKWLKGGAMTREALHAALDRDGIPTANYRGYHILWRHAQEGLICFGPHEGKEPTFVLLDEWIPATKAPERDQALGELARRYFTGHGPATVDDFVWWSGLKVSDAKRGIEAAAPYLAKVESCWMAKKAPAPAVPPRVQFLPGFDEYLLGYRNRDAMLDPKHASKVVPGGNGIFLPMFLLDGRIAGTWKRTVKKKGITVTALPFAPLGKAKLKEAEAALEAYGKFLGLPVALTP